MRLGWLPFIVLLSCHSDRSALPPGPSDPARNLRQLDVFADRVQRESLRAQWQNVPPKPFGVLPLQLLTEDEVATLRRRLSDPQQRRCLDAVHAVAVHIQSESDPEVARALAAITPLRQRLPDLSRMYTDEGDVAVRKERWLAQADTARALEPLVRELIEARNHWAAGRGAPDYLAFMQQFRGYDPSVAHRLEAEVRRALQSQPAPAANPWNYEYIDPALAARMAQKFDAAHHLQRAAFVFHYLGLPEHPPALQVREAQQTAFSPFAFYAIDPPEEQGITVRAGAGIAPHWSAFHENGHAAMSLLTVPGTCRTSRRPISPAVAEGCAKIAERLFYSEEWLQTQDTTPADIAALQEWERQSELTRMRSILDDIELERVLYRNPRGHITRANEPFPSWSLKRHLAYEPLARADYLLARCAQAALYRKLRRMPGGLLGDDARHFVREQAFRGASELRYDEWFQRMTGEAPNCTAWLEDVAQINRGGA